MQVLLKDSKINLLLNAKESLDYLLKFEPSFPKHSEGTKLINLHLLGGVQDVIGASDLEIEFLEINSQNIEESKINSAFFIVAGVDGDFTAEIDIQTLISSGILQKYASSILDQAKEANLYPLNLEQLKAYIVEKEPNEVFTKILMQDLKLAIAPGDALNWIASSFEIGNEQVTSFIKSEFFSTEYSVMLIEKETFIIEDLELLTDIIARKISEDAKKVLVSRYQVAHPELPDVQPLENLAEIIDNSESYSEYKDRLFNKKLIIAKKAFSPIEMLNLDVDPMSLGDALLEFIKRKQVSDKEFTDYIFREDAAEGINEQIIARTDYLILNIFLLDKLSNLPVIDEKTVEVLKDRYESWFSKDNQSAMSVEFQKYFQDPKTIPNDKAVLSSFVEKSTALYHLSSKIDPNIKKGIFKPGQFVEDCEFDEQGFPLVAPSKIDRVLTWSLGQNLSAPSDLVLYVHNNERIPFDSKLPDILRHPNCPLSLLTQYAEDRNTYIYLVRNPALPAEIIESMAEKLTAEDKEIFNLLINHANCSKELKEIIQEGFTGYLNRLISSTEENLLAEQCRKVMFYPQSWSEKFELESAQKHKSLVAILKNKATPIYTIKQILELYQGLAEDPDDVAVLLREPVLSRMDCPKEFIYQMMDSGYAKIRMEVMMSKHFNEEDLVQSALNYALQDFQESLGEYNMSSRRFLESELSSELKLVIKESPFQAQVRADLGQQIIAGIKKDIDANSNITLLSGLFNFLTKNDKFAGEIPISDQDKNDLLNLLNDKRKALKSA